MAIRAVITDLRATFENLGKDLNSANKVLQGFEKRFRTAGKVLGTAVGFGFGAAVVSSMKRFTSQTIGLAKLGDELEDLRQNFVNFGGTASDLDKATKSVHGLISEVDLLKTANTAMAAGIPGFAQNLSSITEFVTRWSEATGNDATESMNKFTKALITGKEKGLQAFGLQIAKGTAWPELFDKMREATERYLPVQGDVSIKAAELANSWDMFQRRLGIVIEKNDLLKTSLEGFKSTLDTIDVDALANGLATIAALFVTVGRGAVVAGKAIVGVGEGIGAFLYALGKTGSISKAAKFADLYEDLNRVQAKLDETSKTPGNPENSNASRFFGDSAAEAEKAAKAAEDFQKKLAGVTAEYESAVMGFQRDLLSKAIEEQSVEGFQSGLEQYDELLQSSITRKLAPLVEEGLITPEAAEHWRQLITNETLEPVMQEWDNKSKEVFQKSVDFWADIFQNAITGVTFDLEDALKRVAVGFASQMAASLTGISFQGGAMGIGQSLAAQLGFGGGGVQGLGASLLGASGAGLLSGTAAGGFIMGAGGTVGPVASGAAYSGMLSGSSIAASVGPAMPYIAAAVGTYMVAKHFGVFGDDKPHPETQARNDVINFLEDKLGRNVVAGPSSRFNGGAGFETLHGMNAASQDTFTAFGNGLNALLGITEDTGGQIAAILADDVGGSVDGLRYRVQQLGISFDDMSEKVIEQGIAMNDTWLETIGTVQGIEEAFKPGKEAVGDVAGAIDDFVHSEGRGMFSVVSLQNAAIEAIEKGGSTLEDFRNMLIESGKLTAEQVDILIKGIQQRGIPDLASLAEASVRTAGSVIADVDAMGFGFQAMTEEIRKTIGELEKLNDEASKLPSGGGSSSGSSDVTASKFGNVFSGGRLMKFAKGGVVNGKTFFNMGVMGEAGPEAIMPLTRKNGVLGVRAVGGGGGTQLLINIDARGAAAGVEHSIQRALQMMRSQIMNDTARLISRSNFDAGRIRGFE